MWIRSENKLINADQVTMFRYDKADDSIIVSFGEGEDNFTVLDGDERSLRTLGNLLSVPHSPLDWEGVLNLPAEPDEELVEEEELYE